MPDPVIDVSSHLERNLERWSKALRGGGDKVAVFRIIYSGKRRRWTAKEISTALQGKVSPKRVTEVGKKLVGDTLVHQVKGEYPVVYEKRDDVHHYKAKILGQRNHSPRAKRKKMSRTVDGRGKVPKQRQATSKRRQPDTAARSRYDVFLSHATEDKGFVRPLVDALKAAGIKVWYDNDVLAWGDDLRISLDKGLTSSKYGIVVFSKAFLKRKHWTEHELNSLFAKERSGKKVILPIWHDVTSEDLLEYSPAFADRVAKISKKDSIDEIVSSVKKLLAK